MKWGQYENLRPAQIDDIKKQTPIAYLPWGALEWHSYHAPIGLDCFKAHGLCKALAKELGGIVLPPVYVGTETIKPYKGFKHTFEHKFETVKSLCSEFLFQLADEEFKVIVLVTGHYSGGHVKAINEAVEEFKVNHTNIGIWAFPDSEPLEVTFKPDHAGPVETSFQMLFKPELVDLSKLPEDRETTLDDDGVWGNDPRDASANQGQEMLRLFLQKTVPKIKQMLEEYGK